MKFTSVVKMFGVASLAAALAFGCSKGGDKPSDAKDKDAKVEAKSEAKSEAKAEAKPAAKSFAAAKPAVLAESSGALAFYDMSKGPLASAYAKARKLSESSTDSSDAALKFVKDAGLDKLDTRWMVFSVGEIQSAEKFPQMCFAISGKYDVSKFAEALKKSIAESNDKDTKLVDGEFAGVKGWKLESKEEELAKNGIVPCFASLDGELALIATSEKTLEGAIKLYRDGAGANGAFKSLETAGNGIVRVVVPEVGKLVGKLAKPEELKGMEKSLELPNAQQVLTGLKTVSAELSAEKANVKLELKVAAASEADAKALEGLYNKSVKPMLELFKMGMAEDKDAKAYVEVLNTIALKVQGAELSLSASAPISLIEKAIDDAAKAAK